MPTDTEIIRAAARCGTNDAVNKLMPLIEALTKRVEELEVKLAETKKEPTNIKISMTNVNPQPKTGVCRRCGRQGHWATTCYATWHADGYELD